MFSRDLFHCALLPRHSEAIAAEAKSVSFCLSWQQTMVPPSHDAGLANLQNVRDARVKESYRLLHRFNGEL